MKIIEALAQAMSANERAFKNVSELQAARIVKLTLAEIAKKIDETDEGNVTVPGFATFSIKQVDRDKDGSKSSHKRVLVRLQARRSGSTEAED